MPTSVQSFSLNLEVMYALPLSHANISKSFNDASRNEIPTFSLDTTIEYVTDYVGAVVWPLDTNLDFLVNLPFILRSNIMSTLKC